MILYKINTMKSIQSIRRLSSSPLSSVYKCCNKKPSKLYKMHLRFTASTSHLRKCYPLISNARNLGLGPTSKDFEDSSRTITGPFTKLHATELVLHLTDEERNLLNTALQEYQSNKIKEEFEDMLAGHRWRSKLGRPSKVPTLGDVDPTGTYCPVPEDWLKKKYAEAVPKPSRKQLLHLSLANSVPFIGFGFLDNFIMIVAGDSIDSMLGAYITLSTMAAAALGNTLSDIIGISSSYYVERGAARLGLAPPPLSPVQLDMPRSRRYSNMGRTLGITLGCFLGMIPLLFKDDENKTEMTKQEPPIPDPAKTDKK